MGTRVHPASWLTCIVFLTFALLCEPADAVTTVTVEGKTIVIHVPIDVRGLRGNKVKDVRTGEVFDAASYIQRNVERIWNEAFKGFSYDCWTFRLDLKLFPLGYDTVTEPHTPGHHLAQVQSSSGHSYWQMTGSDDQCTTCDFVFAYTRDMIGVFNTPEPDVLAHEVGHAMGLADDYFQSGGYKPEAAGIGYEAGVRFLDSQGNEIERGTFMTRGLGHPEPVHLWRIVATMKEAGVLPPCPCASGVRWTGTMQAVHQPGGEQRVTTQVKVQLCEKRRYPLPLPPMKGAVDLITLEDAGSIVTRRHWTDYSWTNNPCLYSGQAVSPAVSPAGEIRRTLEDIGRRGELRWSTPTYWVSLAPRLSHQYTQVCHSDYGTRTEKYEGGDGSWTVISGPERQIPLDGGRMIGSYRDGSIDIVSWSICRDGEACPPLAPLPEPGPPAAAPPSSGPGPATPPPTPPTPSGAAPRAPGRGGGGFLRP